MTIFGRITTTAMYLSSWLSHGFYLFFFSLLPWNKAKLLCFMVSLVHILFRFSMMQKSGILKGFSCFFRSCIWAVFRQSYQGFVNSLRVEVTAWQSSGWLEHGGQTQMDQLRVGDETKKKQHIGMLKKCLIQCSITELDFQQSNNHYSSKISTNLQYVCWNKSSQVSLNMKTRRQMSQTPGVCNFKYVIKI